LELSEQAKRSLALALTAGRKLLQLVVVVVVVV
jgi:hypothetical protein